MIVRRPLHSSYKRRRVPYWTRERILDGMRRFYRVHGYAPTSSEAWGAATPSRTMPPHRPYPSHATILQHFGSLRQAWAAAGIETDRSHEDFTPAEHWYIREAAGLITREEIARDLRRTPMAVKSYLRDHGLHSYTIHGWSLGRVTRLTGLSRWQVERRIKRGTLPAVKGSKSYIVQPLDLLRLEEIDWTKAPREIEMTVRRGLYERLLGVLEMRLALGAE